jgi:N utilization substance protein A
VCSSDLLNPDGTPVIEAPKYNPKLHLAFTEARVHQADANVGDHITIPLPVPGAFGRMAAQTAKQVVTQRLREAERDTIYNQWKGREGELLIGTVNRTEGRLVFIDLGQRAIGVLREEEQIPTDRYVAGVRFRLVLSTVAKSLRGPEILLSRTHPDLLRKLFEMEVPEVSSGAVEIRGVAREPGSRAKVAVVSTQENVDPIGACIGQRGTRVQTVIAELGGEKIDIIQYDEKPEGYVANAMAPAKVADVSLDAVNRVAIVRVPPEQFSLAIGRGGQNVRLAARLTGWRISVQEARTDGAAGAVVSGAPEDAPPPAVEPEAIPAAETSVDPEPSAPPTDAPPSTDAPSTEAAS